MAARDGLISTTIDLVRRRGVAGTGLAEIVSTSGRSRRTVYLNFPDGKAQMVTEATRTAGAATEAMIARLGRERSPRAGLDEFIAFWRHTLQESDFDAGCPIMAAALAHEGAPTAAAAAGEVFDRWTARLAETMINAGVDAEAATALAVTVVAAIEGAIAMAQASRSTAPLDHVRAVLAPLLPDGAG